MAAAALGIVAVAVLAGYFPAGRATTIDPVCALRLGVAGRTTSHQGHTLAGPATTSYDSPPAR
jgi:hypothetical protein